MSEVVYAPPHAQGSFFSRLMRSRDWYADTSSWIVALRHAAIARGLPVPGKGKKATLRVKGYPDPFQVRLGTTDIAVIHEIMVGGEYEGVRERVSPRARTIIDLGANVGISARLWRGAFPEAKVHAVEPDSSNFEICRWNLSSQGDKASLVRACISDKPGQVRLARDSRGEWATRMAEGDAEGHETVEAITMCQLLEREKIAGDVDLLKIDIEGAERRIFEDPRSGEWLTRIVTMVVELESISSYSVEQFLADVRRGDPRLTDATTLRLKGDMAIVLVRRRSPGG